MFVPTIVRHNYLACIYSRQSEALNLQTSKAVYLLWAILWHPVMKCEAWTSDWMGYMPLICTDDFGRFYAYLVTEYESHGKTQAYHLTVKFRRLWAYITINSTVVYWMECGIVISWYLIHWIHRENSKNSRND